MQTESLQGPKFLFISGPTTVVTKEARRHLAKASYDAKNRRGKSVIKVQSHLPLPWRRRPGLDASVGKSKSNVLRRTQRARHSQNLVEYHPLIADADRLAVCHNREAGEEKYRKQTGRTLLPRNRPVQPMALVGNGHSDPFGASCVPIDATVNQMLCHSRDYYVLAKWPGERDFHEKGSAMSFWMEDMRNKITAKAPFHAALALATQYMANVEHQPQKKSALIHQSLYQKSLALTSIRQSLQRNILDQNIILAILDLTGADGYAGGHNHFPMHMVAVKEILNKLGGIHAINDEIRTWIGVIDSSGSFIAFTRPTFPVEDWDLGSWQHQSMSRFCVLERMKSWQGLDPDLISLGLRGLPFPFLKETLESLYEIVVVWKVSATLTNRRYRNQLFKWITVRRSAIKAHCLNNYFDIVEEDWGRSVSAPDSHCIIAAAVCQVALCLQGLVIYPPTTVIAHSPLQFRSAVKIALSDVETQNSRHSPMLNLWLSFGGFVIEELSGLQSQNGGREMFGAKFGDAVGQLQLKSWQQAGSVLKIFLHDDTLDKFLEPLFREFVLCKVNIIEFT